LLRFFLFLRLPRTPRPTLFPYTTLFRSPFAAGILVGSRGEQLEKFLTNRIEVLRAEAAAYAGKLKSEFTNTVGYDLKRVEKLQRSEEHTSELQSRENLVCRLLLEKKKKK